MIILSLKFLLLQEDIWKANFALFRPVFVALAGFLSFRSYLTTPFLYFLQIFCVRFIQIYFHNTTMLHLLEYEH